MRTTDSIAKIQMAEVRRRAIFECCKWDPQCEDLDVLCPFAIVLDSDEWRLLSSAVRELTSEVLAAEQEILKRPELLKPLGLPRSIRRVLNRHRLSAVQSGPRVMRFDFHWTAEGWRISEANTDVPGGFIEGGGFTQLVADCFDECAITGNPAEQLVSALISNTSRIGGHVIGLVHATAYTDDRQVMIYLAKKLQARGARALLLSPSDLRWSKSRAFAIIDGDKIAVDQIMRFYPAEWLPQLPRQSGWQHFFCDSPTAQCNPASALISQSKRFPLVWDQMQTKLDAWRRWLPATCDPRNVHWQGDDQWVLKTAFGRVGDGIALAGVTPPKEHAKIARSARWWPAYWAAQRRFDALPIDTPHGQQFASIGVFTIDGHPAGIYARLSDRPLIDHRARDVAVLVQQPQMNRLKLATPEHIDESRATV